MSTSNQIATLLNIFSSNSSVKRNIIVRIFIIWKRSFDLHHDIFRSPWGSPNRTRKATHISSVCYKQTLCGLRVSKKKTQIIEPFFRCSDVNFINGRLFSGDSCRGCCLAAQIDGGGCLHHGHHISYTRVNNEDNQRRYYGCNANDIWAQSPFCLCRIVARPLLIRQTYSNREMYRVKWTADMPVLFSFYGYSCMSEYPV